MHFTSIHSNAAHSRCIASLKQDCHELLSQCYLANAANDSNPSNAANAQNAAINNNHNTDQAAVINTAIDKLKLLYITLCDSHTTCIDILQWLNPLLFLLNSEKQPKLALLV